MHKLTNIEQLNSDIDEMIIAIEGTTSMFQVHKEWFKARLLHAKTISKLFDKTMLYFLLKNRLAEYNSKAFKMKLKAE